MIVTKTHVLDPKWTHLDKPGSCQNKVWFIAENAVLIMKGVSKKITH